MSNQVVNGSCEQVGDYRARLSEGGPVLKSIVTSVVKGKCIYFSHRCKHRRESLGMLQDR